MVSKNSEVSSFSPNSFHRNCRTSRIDDKYFIESVEEGYSDYTTCKVTLSGVFATNVHKTVLHNVLPHPGPKNCGVTVFGHTVDPATSEDTVDAKTYLAHKNGKSADVVVPTFLECKNLHDK